MASKYKLTEGLRKNDLKNLVHPVFEVDTFKSKMGNDSDVCVITFQAKDRHSARDLTEFIEKGCNFVLDADTSAGENKDGEYSVFVEIERNDQIGNHISELLYDLKNLTGIDQFKYRYYKQDNLRQAAKESLNEIPKTEIEYLSMIKEYQVDATRSFFNKTVMDSISVDDNIITITKPFGNKIQLEVINQGETETVLTTIEDSLIENTDSTAETFWLTKVLGNYNITKYGDNFLFVNENRAMLLKRRP